MTKLEELQEWNATGANYHKGVALCEKHKIRTDLTNGTFKEGAIPGNKRLLMQIILKEIQTLENSFSLPSNNKKDVHSAVTVRAQLEENWGMKAKYPNIKLNEDTPRFIQQMFMEAMTTWGQAVKLHDEELVNPDATDEERYAIMKKIATAYESNDAAHIELKHYNDTGEILGKHASITQNSTKTDPSAQEKKLRKLSTAELVNTSNSNRLQISKTKSALSKKFTNELNNKLTNLEETAKLLNALIMERMTEKK